MNRPSEARSTGLACPVCGAFGAQVTDSRPRTNALRRRRQCSLCHNRFTTIEVIVDKRTMSIPDLSAISADFQAALLTLYKANSRLQRALGQRQNLEGNS